MTELTFSAVHGLTSGTLVYLSDFFQLPYLCDIVATITVTSTTAFTVPLYSLDMSNYTLGTAKVTPVARLETILAARTFTYTDAMQTADFGAVQNPVNVKVFQVSSTVGRGYSIGATL